MAHVNHLYLLSKAAPDLRQSRPVILDYGCGRGDRHGWMRISRISQFPLIQPLGCMLFQRFGGAVIMARRGRLSDEVLIKD